MEIFKKFMNDKKREMTIEAFDTIVEDKKEKAEEFVKNNKREIAIAVGVAVGVVILGCLKMKCKRNEKVVVIINNK